MSAFTVANLVAYCTTGYWTLMAARILLALSAMD
jgi:predicted MFS family arabinose efflux permease